MMSQEPHEDDFDPSTSLQAEPIDEPPEGVVVFPAPRELLFDPRTGLLQSVYQSLPRDLRDRIEGAIFDVDFHEHFAEWLIGSGLYRKAVRFIEKGFWFDNDTADLVVVDSADAVFKMLLRGAEVTNLSGLLWQSIRNRARTVARRRRPETVSVNHAPEPCTTDPDAETQMELEKTRAAELAEFRRQFREAFRGASRKDQRIIILRWLRGYSNAMAAEWLGISPAQASLWFHRARQRFDRRREFP